MNDDQKVKSHTTVKDVIETTKLEESCENHENCIFIEINKTKYWKILGAMLGTMVVYLLIQPMLMMGGSPNGMGVPPTNGPPSLPNTIPSGSSFPSQGTQALGTIWPLWGSFNLPSITNILVFLITFGCIFGFYLILKKYSPKMRYAIVGGIGLIFLSNLIQGWNKGIFMSIGGTTEIYSDLPLVKSISDFISNYNSIQEILSVHAQTQPPGAVLWIYFLNLIGGSASVVAILVLLFSGVLSAFFLHKIFLHFYPDEKENAMWLIALYLALPAVQVYYLANIYAIIATLAFGVLYCYFSDSLILKFLGGILFLIGTFTSFLFATIGLILGLYELFNFIEKTKIFQKKRVTEIPKQKWQDLLKKALGQFGWLIIYLILMLSFYLGLYLLCGFNYLEAFQFASALENPDGFMLFSTPSQYFITRLQDILDIAFFFGPILCYLFYLGFQMLKEEKSDNLGVKRIYFFVIAGLIGLGLLFLTGAPKKGETARICMFVLPFLLFPVFYYLKQNHIKQSERAKLWALVTLQGLIMQLVMNFVW